MIVMKNNLKKADEVLQELREHVRKLLEQKEVPYGTVASALMFIAQQLYKTNLSETDFKNTRTVSYQSGETSLVFSEQHSSGQS